MNLIADLSHRTFAGSTLLAWAEALTALVFVTVALRLFQVIALRRLKELADRFHMKWASHGLSALEQTKLFLLLLVGAGAGGGTFLHLPKDAGKVLGGIVVVAFFAQCGIWLSAFYSAWYADYRQRHLKQNAAAVTTLDATRTLVRLVIWLFVLLLALNALGFNISALVTGLGVGGVAIALAVQKILSDVLASLAIVTDKPFAIGDFLVMDSYMGSVEYIGLKTTRLRSLGGELLIFSNSDLLGSRIRNYGRMYERRVDVTIGVTYDTPRDKLTRIPQMIKDAVAAEKNTRLDRAHFKDFGAYSLDFEYVYYVLSPDYNTYMDIQQAINLTLHKRFEEEGIEFAFPTQTLLVQKSA